MRHNNKFNLFILVGACLSMGYAHSQDKFETQSGNAFKLSAASEYGVVDNFFYSQNDEEETSVFSVSTRLAAQIQFERQLFTLNSTSRHTLYNEYSVDNHSVYELKPSYQFKIGGNKSLFIDGYYDSIFENRGTGLSLGKAQSITTGDEKEIKGYSAGYIYGSRDSVARLLLSFGSNSAEYLTRRQYSQRFDKKSDDVKLSFDYLLSGQSYIATDFQYERLKFTKQAIQDKDKYSALVGLKWQSTNITQLSLLFGYQKIKFIESSFEDDEAFKWRANVVWHPIVSTKISLQSERNFDTANRISNSYRVVDKHDIKVTSKFTNYFQVSAGVGMKFEDTITESGVINEDYLSTNLQVTYQRSNWLSLYIKYVFNDLDASDSTLSFQRNSISMGINVSI